MIFKDVHNTFVFSRAIYFFKVMRVHGSDILCSRDISVSFVTMSI